MIRFRSKLTSSGKTYYYYDLGGKPRKWLRLGSDYVSAVEKWAELERNNSNLPRELVTFSYVADIYMRDVLQTKALKTRKENILQLVKLREFFNNPPAPIHKIRPIHIRQYLDWRKTAPVSANREKALFSHIWNKAREWGYTDLENPCKGVSGYKEKGRDMYVEDSAFQALWNAADEQLQDALDLAYLTGQRPADVLKLSRIDIRDGALWITQNKTGKKLRVEIVGKLAAVIARIQARSSNKVTTLSLIALSAGALKSRFNKARKLAGVDFQFRDIRAKAATDTEDLAHSQKLLGHASRDMTEAYTRNRIGDKVKPTK